VTDALLAPCGTYCEYCDYHRGERTPPCAGCGTHQGHPFWGDCKLHACAHEHQVDHCGVCREFPCAVFVNQYDPDHGQTSAFTRAGLLAYRKTAGTEKYKDMVKKLEAADTP
jgi:hypothetical protein